VSDKLIKFTGEFSLLSAIAIGLYAYFVWDGSLPWWSFFIAWLYQMDFITVNLRKLLGMKEQGY
jgi:hypothetical protein